MSLTTAAAHPDLAAIARAARSSQRVAAAQPAASRTHALERLAEILTEREPELLAANALDLEAARTDGLAAPLLRRLELTPAKLETLRDGARQLAASEDPIGSTIRATELDDDLVLSQVRSPIGVLLVIFESRPDAVIQIGSLALRSGNALLLKGGKEAANSNRVLVDCLRAALGDTGLPEDTITLVEGRAAVAALLDHDDDIDLVIPRGSASLVRSIQSSTRIPVLGHADGICHLYVDRDADVAMAIQLAIDGKCDAPSACNATETILVHREWLANLGALGKALTAAGVAIKADAAASELIPEADLATDTDWATEWGDLTISVRIVDDMPDAIAHIHQFGSGHTDAIVTNSEATARRFLDTVDAASVFWNASTRFADGYRYGLGAEVGISTGRIHARGPVGIDGLMTTRWLLEGAGHIAADYSTGTRTFTHRPLQP